LLGCASYSDPFVSVQAQDAQASALESRMGIKLQGLRLSAAGSMLDLRYRVLDAKKAAPLLDGKNQVVLIDDLRGAKLGVPDTPVLGRIRQTARNNAIATDRSYFIMFANPGKAMRVGDLASLQLGQEVLGELKVQ
jgi:hypothetical protein